jgi:predicted kinase
LLNEPRGMESSWKGSSSRLVEALRRLRERTEKRTGSSDATEEVYLCQRSEFVPLRELSARQHLVLDTTEGTERLLPRVENSLGHLFEPS